MKIAVNMVFESADEFVAWARMVGLISTEQTDDAGEEEATSASGAKPPARRRRRRTKKQMEDAVAKVAGTEEIPTESHAVSIVPSPDASNEAELARTAKEISDLAKEAQRVYTLQDAVPILRAYITNNSSAAVIAKLKEYGAKRVQEVAPERLSEFLTELVTAS